MYQPSLRLKADETVAIVVDPLHDFMSRDGIFARHFGQADTEPLRCLLPELQFMIAHFRRKKVRLILCRSLYEYDDEVNVPGLEGLCATQEGRRSLILREAFHDEIEKINNNILSAGDKIKAILSGVRNSIFGGVTTTSCIGVSIGGCNKNMPSLHVVVPRNAVASRKNQQQKQEELFQKWKNLSNVSIVDSWKNIDLY